MSLVANPINFASISVSGPVQIVILIYWPCVQKMEVVTIFDFLPHCGDVDDIFFGGGLAKCVRRRTPFASRKSFTSTNRSTSAVRWFLEEDDGEAESAKSEMMVASSVLFVI